MAELVEKGVENGATTGSIFDDSSEDFELISDSNLIDAATNFSIIDVESVSKNDGDKSEYENQVKPHVIEPYEAFEMIQNEHRLLKDEMVAQNQILRDKLMAIEERDRAKAEEVAVMKSDLETASLQVASLKKKIDNLTLDVKEKEVRQNELERQLNYFKENSEKADVLTAKLMEAEDVVKTQNIMIRQLQTDGCVSVPKNSTSVFVADQSLVAEMKEKDALVRRLEGTLASLESALGSMNGERLKACDEAFRLAQRNADLQELITSLQSQAEADKAEWVAIRFDLEQQIQMLSDRVTAFEKHFNGARSLVEADVEVATLSHRGTTSHGSSNLGSTSPSSYVECQRCHLPMVNAGPHPGCPAIIDALD